MNLTLNLYKMSVELINGEVHYYLSGNNNNTLHVNDAIGKTISLEFLNQINCISCGKKTNKSFNQGFCYNCFINAPEAAPCIIHPEQCEAHLNKGRDVVWEQKHHNQPHIVYLSQTSHVKVGVTRDRNIPSRWIDQGAHKAVILAEVPYRRLAGEIEVALKPFISDKTNWRKMLQNSYENINLMDFKSEMTQHLPAKLQQYVSENNDIIAIKFPVIQYPEKVKSINLEKTPFYKGKLTGIKGQYFLFEDQHVINIRKYGGYLVNLNIY